LETISPCWRRYKEGWPSSLLLGDDLSLLEAIQGGTAFIPPSWRLSLLVGGDTRRDGLHPSFLKTISPCWRRNKEGRPSSLLVGDNLSFLEAKQGGMAFIPPC
jgi:hypothetical protein